MKLQMRKISKPIFDILADMRMFSRKKKESSILFLASLLILTLGKLI